MPGLGLIPDPDFITLLQVSSSFPEAFLIGASDEMGRELLWRDFPTDQRGTCFRRFWDAAEDELTADIHRFSRRPVGSHFRIGGTGGVGRAADPLAVVIKGELLRRFPETAVVVLRAKDGPDGPIFGEHDLDPVTSQPMEARILFHAQLKPDYTVIGVDLTLAEVLDPARNWWIILAQNPTAPRFGFASADGKPLSGTSSDRDDLDWDDLPGVSLAGFLTPAGNITVRDDQSKPATVRWPGNAAVTARVMLKNPIRAAFRAADLIGRIASGP